VLYRSILSCIEDFKLHPSKQLEDLNKSLEHSPHSNREHYAKYACLRQIRLQFLDRYLRRCD